MHESTLYQHSDPVTILMGKWIITTGQQT